MKENDDEREVLASHQSDLLTQDLILTGIFKYCKFKEYGFSFNFPFIKYNHDSGNITYPKWQVEELKNKEISGKNFDKLINFLEDGLKSYREYLKIFEEEIKSDKDKVKKIKEYFEKSLKEASSIPYFAFEACLYKKLDKEGITPKDIPSTLTATSMAWMELEKISQKYRLELGSLKEKEAKISELLKKELKDFCYRFGYLGMIYFKGNPWTVSDAYRMLFTAESKKIVNKDNYNSSKILKIASNLLKLRTQKWELMCRGTYLFRKYIEKYFDNEIVYQDLLNLRLEEVIKIIDGIYSEKEIGRGREHFTLEIKENGVILFLENKKNAVDEDKTRVKEIIGIIAQSGKVRGQVKIVLSAKDSFKVEQGDILVTKMSTPDFLPAMKRAAAFVTDIGGITSHAAIVAREMNKPCIIGTKNATKILKDGDLIEVDGDKGVVRILKK